MHRSKNERADSERKLAQLAVARSAPPWAVTLCTRHKKGTCARLTGASAAGASPAGRRRRATTSTPSHGHPFARAGVKR